MENSVAQKSFYKIVQQYLPFHQVRKLKNDLKQYNPYTLEGRKIQFDSMYYKMIENLTANISFLDSQTAKIK